MASSDEPLVHSVYEPTTGTWQYIVIDPQTKRAAIIDSVLDFDPSKNELSTKSADDLLALVETEQCVVEALLETHLHADHLSGANYLCEQLRKKQHVVPRLCIGSGVEKMQRLFASRYGVPDDEWRNAFDKMYPDGATFSIGNLEVSVLSLPGHTPDHVGYQIGRNVFAGDSIFNPDLGSARCDFPQGSAAALWNSMHRLLSLPSDYRLYTGHDYPPSERAGDEGTGKPKAYATVGEHKASNIHVKDGTSESTFVSWREQRDSSLNEPRLINQALQFNIRGGRIPRKTSTGDRLIHIPLKIPQSLAAA